MTRDHNEPLIRRCTGEDFRAVVTIWMEGVACSYGKAAPSTFKAVPFFRNWIAEGDPALGIWVACLDGVIVGWIGLQSFSRSPLNQWGEVSLYVSKAFKGGAGRALL